MLLAVELPEGGRREEGKRRGEGGKEERERGRRKEDGEAYNLQWGVQYSGDV